MAIKEILDRIRVFIHSSIKTRIETYWKRYKQELNNCVFIHSSIKTRIETNYTLTISGILSKVFIHSSIKTRIETPPS